MLAAFFPSGVRANNGTVAAAMEHGAVVITNLDEFSPPEFVHMHNVVDINRCEELPLESMTAPPKSLTKSFRQSSFGLVPEMSRQTRIP